MGDMRRLKADHELAEFGQREPERHLSPQHAALADRIVAALSGNDENGFCILRLGATQKGEQRGMGLRLRTAVQIKPGVDGLKTAREPLLGAAIDRRKRRQLRGGARRKNRLGNRLAFG